MADLVSIQSAQDRYVADIAVVIAVQTFTPYWASGYTQLAHSRYLKVQWSRVVPRLKNTRTESRGQREPKAAETEEMVSEADIDR